VFERYTDRARQVLVLAQQEARRSASDHIGTEHLLLGLIDEGEALGVKAIESMGIRLDDLRGQIEARVGPAGSSVVGSPPFTPEAKRVFELAYLEARQLGHSYVGTEHLLLGILREGRGVAADVLVTMGADLEPVRQRVLDMLDSASTGEERARRSTSSRRADADRSQRGSRYPRDV
jgi:ATP-dependent Clp protease ATP-binding subunit ClpC